jgi:hypothetical protein
MTPQNHPTSTRRLLSTRSIRIALLFGLIGIVVTVLSAPSFANSISQKLFAGAATIISGGSVQKTNAKHSSSVEFIATVESATMASEREGHTATRLADGRVLIAGGENAGGALNQTEIYDPSSATFSTAANMTSARVNHSATLLADGRVLIAGGHDGGASLATTEIFDPATGAFTSGPTMSVARAGHSATLFANGRVLIAGGDSSGSAEVLDLASESSTAAGSMSVARSQHSAALLQDGRVLVVGGKDANGNALSTGEIFDPQAGSFAAINGSLKVGRVGAHLRVLFDGKVQIIGGSNDGSMEIYDPSFAGFGAYAHVLPEGDTCAGLSGQIQSSQTRAALFHNGQSDATFDRSSHSISELSGQAIVIGGVNSSGVVLSSTPLFNSTDAAISTDKLDYSPGETAHIIGHGFQPGETVRLKIHEDPHTPQERGFDATADAEGNFSGDYLVMDYDFNMKFIVGARGLSSGRTAQTTFTDARNLILTFAGTGSGTVTVSASTGTVNAPVSCGGSGTAQASQTVSATCVPNITTSDNGATVTFNAVANAGSTFAGWSGQANLSSSTCTGTTNPCSAVLGGGPTLTVTFNNATVNTTTAVANKTATYGDASVTLTATVTPASGPAINSGSVTFTVKQGPTTIGVATTDNTIVAGAASVSYLLPAGTNAGSYTIEAAYTPGTGFNASSGTGSLTIDKASSSTTINCPTSVTYNGSPQTPCTATATGAGGLNVSVTVTYGNNTDAGTATADASYAGDANHNGSTATQVTFTIDKANSSTTINCPTSVSYNGSPQTPCTATATGAGGLNVSVTVVYGNNTNAGTATADATYGGDANHNGSTATQVTFTIDKANSSTTINCPTNVTYNGSPQTPCTATATGAGGLNVSVTVVYGNNTNAGTATADATYAGDANHNGSTATQVTFTIDKANSSTTINCPTNVTYNGSPLTPCTATATGAGGLNVSVTVVYGNNTNAGTATADATYAGDANHNGSTATQVTFTIDKANSSTTINCPTNVTYNGSPQTPCTATATGAGGLNVSVTVVYGNNTNAGTATADATYAGDANHNGSTATQVTFTIDKANSSTSINCPTNVTYNGLPQTPCTATATGAGGLNVSVTVVYGNNTNAGTATADATYAGDANHNGSTATQVTFTIDKADSSTSINCPTNVTYNGLPQTPCTATATGAGGLNVSVTVIYGNNTNAGTATADATYGGDTNHNGSTATQVTFTIDKADSSTTINCPTNVTYNGSPQTPCTATATGAGGLNVSVTVIYGNNTNAGLATADAIYAGDANHNGSTATQVTFTIDKADSSTTINCPTNVTYDGSPQTPCTATATGAGGLSVSVTVVYGNNTNAGTATADATFPGDANHNSSTATQVTFTIDKAGSSTTINCPTNVTYNGSPQTPCTATATGAGGLNVSVTVVYGNNTNAGTATADATFAGDANHNGSTATQVTFAIDKRTLTASITGNPTKVYDANTSATLTPANFLIGNLVAGQSITVTKTTGTYNSKDVATANNVSTTLASGDFSAGAGTNLNNYNLPASASGAGQITAKGLAITADNKSFLFGAPLATLTASFNAFATGEGVGNLTGTLTFTLKDALNNTVPYNAGTPAGTYTIVPSGVTNTNYNISFVNGTLTIGAWTLMGFYQPVDMSGGAIVWNSIKGGSTVPLKFNIFAAGVEKKAVTDVQGFAVAEVPCSSSGYTTDVEFTTTGGTSLRYDTTGGQFIQNWQTPKPAGKCYQVRMTALDGSHLDAYFKSK